MARASPVPWNLICRSRVDVNSLEVLRAATLPMYRMQYLLAALAACASFAHASAQAAAAVPSGSRPAELRACSWDHPGRNAFTGDVPDAVDRYTDLAPAVRERLKARMRAHDYDDVVEISRNRIEGAAGYSSEIRDMHFGAGQVCGAVTREGWTDVHRERALVYCDGNDCVMVPTVCRNVSRIARVPGGGAPPEGELLFDPPGAGAPQPVSPEVPPLATTLPPAPLSGVPLTPPGAFSNPPPASIGPPSGGPPINVPTPPVITLPPPDIAEVPPPAVPEPSSWAMAVAGLVLLAAWLRRASRKAS